MSHHHLSYISYTYCGGESSERIHYTILYWRSERWNMSTFQTFFTQTRTAAQNGSFCAAGYKVSNSLLDMDRMRVSIRHLCIDATNTLVYAGKTSQCSTLSSKTNVSMSQTRSHLHWLPIKTHMDYQLSYLSLFLFRLASYLYLLSVYTPKKKFMLFF